MFNREKNLLVIPILLAEIDESKYPNGVPTYANGDYTWSGAYVFDITPENGFELNGRISHNDGYPQNCGYWNPYSNNGNSIKRSFYINDVLYTYSDTLLKMTNLDDLSTINELSWNQA